MTAARPRGGWIAAGRCCPPRPSAAGFAGPPTARLLPRRSAARFTRSSAGWFRARLLTWPSAAGFTRLRGALLAARRLTARLLTWSSAPGVTRLSARLFGARRPSRLLGRAGGLACIVARSAAGSRAFGGVAGGGGWIGCAAADALRPFRLFRDILQIAGRVDAVCKVSFHAFEVHLAARTFVRSDRTLDDGIGVGGELVA